jgi:hypothetical protein
MAPDDSGDTLAGGEPRTYRLVSASFREKAFPDGVLLVDPGRSEIELRQRTGRRKKEQTTIARFRIEPTAVVQIDGPVLRISELSVTLQSPSQAGEIAELLRAPGRELELTRLVTEAVSAVRQFTETRERAMTFLAKMRVNPREAMMGEESAWAADDSREPLEAVYSSYSTSVAGSLDRMTSSLDETEKELGRDMVERLYALAYVTVAIQDALFDGESELGAEVAALQELGIAATALELRMGAPSERVVERAHPVLVAIATAEAPAP